MAKVKVTYGANVLDTTKQVVSFEVEGITLKEALLQFAKGCGDPELSVTKVIVYRNFIKIDCEHWDSTELEEGDFIEIIPYIGFVGAAPAVVAVISSWFWYGAAAAATAVLGYYAYDYARDYLKELERLMEMDFDYQKETPTYNWTGARTTCQEGIPIPVVYGAHMVGGNVIGERVSYPSKYQSVLSVTLCLGESTFNLVDIDNSLINDEAISSYGEGAIGHVVHYNGGEGESEFLTVPINTDLPCKPEDEGGEASFFDIAQKVGENLNARDLTGIFPSGTTVNFKTDREWLVTYTSNNTMVESLIINMSYIGITVPIAVRYGYVDSPYDTPDEWIYVGDTYIAVPTKTTTMEVTGRIIPGTNTLERTSYTVFEDVKYYCEQRSRATVESGEPVEIPPRDPYRRGNTNRYRYYNGVFLLLNPSENQKKTLYSLRLYPGSVPDKYVKVQVKRLDINPNHHVMVDSIVEAYGGLVFHESVTMVTFKFNEATEALSGSTPNFRIKVEGQKNIRRYTSPSSYVTEYTNNPVWCLCDLITNKRYGAGEWLTYDDFDIATLIATANYCDTNELTCSLVLDSSMEFFEAVNTFLECFCGMIVFGTDGKIKILADRPAVTRQIFNQSNIIKGSLTYSFGSRQSEFNALEIRYAEEKQYYEQVALFMATGELPVKEQTIALRGISNEKQATFVGAYKLKRAAYCNSSVTFKTTYKALACEAGDLIGIQDTSISSAVYGGRILSVSPDGTTRHVLIDQELELDPNLTYTIMFSYPGTSGIVVGTATIINYDEEGRTLSFVNASFPTVIDEDTSSAHFILYPTTETVSLFRIVKIQQDLEDRTFEIAAVKYDERIFDPSDLIISRESEYRSINRVAAPVLNLSVERKGDGTGFLIWFDAPPDCPNYQTARIQYRTSGGVWYTIPVTMPYADGFEITANIEEGRYYEFRVVSINSAGQANVAQAPSITAYSSAALFPPQVQGLQIVGRGTATTFVGRDCTITWTPIAPSMVTQGSPSIIGYVIEIVVSGIMVRREHTATNRYTYTHTMNVEDNGTAQRTFTFRVYAENSAHLLSELPAELTVTNLTILTPQNLTANFEDKDCVVYWTAPDSSVLSHYDIQVFSEFNGAGSLRSTHVSYDTRFLYTFTQNLHDTDGEPDRTLSFNVRSVDLFGYPSEWVTVNAENEAPSLVTGGVATGVLGGVCISWNALTDKDTIGYDLYAAVGRAVTIDDYQLFTNTTSHTFVSIGSVHLSSGDVVHARVVGRDAFGAGNFEESVEVEGIVQGLELENWNFDVPLPSGVTFSVSAGRLYWTGGTLLFGGTVYVIGAGNTTNAYVYWDEGNGYLSTSAYMPTMHADRWLMCYFDGEEYWVAAANKIIHGGLIQAGTITVEDLYVERLSALSTRTGQLEIDATGYLRGGQTNYAIGTGFWLGYHDGTYKLSMDGESGDYLHFDGNEVSLRGTILIEPGSTGLNNLGAGYLAYLDQLSTQNEVNNADFAQWSRGPSLAPDSWVAYGTGVSIAQMSTDPMVGAYYAQLTNGAGYQGLLYQEVHASKGLVYWRGRTIVFGAWVRTSTANRARLAVWKAGETYYSPYHSGSGVWEFLTTDAFTVPQDATYIRLGLENTSGTSFAASIDGAIAVEGTVLPPFAPKGISSSSGTGLVLDSYRMGFINSGVWQSYIQNDGLFRFGGNSNNYLEWTGVYYDISTTGALRLLSGGVIELYGGEAFEDRAKIIFKGNSWDHILTSDSYGTVLYMNSNAPLSRFHIGGGPILQRYNAIIGDVSEIAEFNAVHPTSSVQSTMGTGVSSSQSYSELEAYSVASGYARVKAISDITSGAYVSLAGRIIGEGSGFNGCRIRAGNYTGNASTSQVISGLYFQPLFIVIWRADSWANLSSTSLYFKVCDTGHTYAYCDGVLRTNVIYDVTSTSFRVGGVANATGEVYRYMVIG